MNKLTEIENRFAVGLSGFSDNLPGFDIRDPWWWPLIRQKMRTVAYHEAGHYAARCFTWYDPSLVLSLSIIPNCTSAGRMVYESSIADRILKSLPPPFRRTHGRTFLLCLLAGYGAEMILDQTEQCKSIFDYFENNYCNGKEITDLSKALSIAEFMAEPYMPARRILNLIDKWTLEMLMIPAVWNIVETVADKLMGKGEIMEPDKEFNYLTYGSDFLMAHFIPKWSRRLFLFNSQESNKYIEHI